MNCIRCIFQRLNSMKYNVIIFRISENNGTDEANLKRWLLVLIKDVYQKVNINITSIHRTGHSRNNKPRDVVVRFADSVTSVLLHHMFPILVINPVYIPLCLQ